MIDLRALTEADADWASAALAGIEPWWTLGYSVGTLRGYLTRPDPALNRNIVWIEGQRVGVVALRHPWLRGPYLELLAITLPGRGLGSQVIRWAVDQAGPNLWACVSDFNTCARQFYENQGFVEAAVLPDLVVPGRNEVLMRRRVVQR